MTLGDPPLPGDPTTDGSRTSAGWTPREREIIFRNPAAQPPPADASDVAPVPVRRGARSIRLSPERRRLDRWQVAALAVFGFALLAILVGALASIDRSGSPTPQVATRSPVDAGRTRAASSGLSAAPTSPERRELSPDPISSPAGEAVVRAFYDALGRGDGEAASVLVVAEKRTTEAFSARAISRFYGGLREPLRPTAITPLDDGAFFVGYRYSAGRTRCEGGAVVTLSSRDGRDLIRSIRTLNGC